MRLSHLTLVTLPLGLALTACTIKDFSIDDSGLFGGSGGDENIPACGGFTEVEGANLGYGGYPDSTASAGPECMCQVEKSSPSPVSHYVLNTTVSGSSPEPKKVDIQTPFDAPTANSTTTTLTGWESRFQHSSSVAVTIDGTYTLWQSKVDDDDQELSCSDYPDSVIDLDFAPAGPPAAPSSSEGDEDAMRCSGEGPVKARFQLAHLPGRADLAPLFVSGNGHFDGLELSAVKVVDWGEMDALTVLSDAGERTLKPGSGELTLPESSAWLWSTRFLVDDQIGQLPTVELEGRCYAEQAPMSVAPGYLTTADTLAPWLDSSARVIARVVEDGRDDTPETHHLMFELEGTGFSQGIPIHQRGADTWDVAFNGDSLQLDGQLTRDQGGLTLKIADGDMMGVGDLSGRSLTFAPYND